MKPLDGVTIVDLSQIVAGPFATQLLAEQGPDVVKVEPLDDPQIAHNGILVEWDHPVAGPLRQTGPPVRFETMPTPLVEQIDVLGGHTDEILAELGRSPAQIGALRHDGVTHQWGVERP